MSTPITQRYLTLWLVAGLSAPLAHASGAGWLACTLAAGAMLPLAAMSAPGWQNLNRWTALAECIWLAVVLAALASQSGAYWPTESGEWVVPVVLLALAAVSGPAPRAARCALAASWLLVLAAAPLVLAGTVQLSRDRLMPYASPWSAGLLIALLLPSLCGIFRQNQGAVWAPAALLAPVLGALTQGVLSGFVASSVQTPFYEMARALTLANGRWEPLAAVCVTLGYYILCNFLMAAIRALCATAHIPEKQAVWGTFAVSTALVMGKVTQNGPFLTVLTVIMWVLVPMLHEKILPKKDEKSA